MAVGSGEPDSEGAVRRSGLAMVAPLGEGVHAVQRHPLQREFIDYKTSMITYEDPLRGLLFY